MPLTPEETEKFVKDSFFQNLQPDRQIKLFRDFANRKDEQFQNLTAGQQARTSSEIINRFKPTFGEKAAAFGKKAVEVVGRFIVPQITSIVQDPSRENVSTRTNFFTNMLEAISDPIFFLDPTGLAPRVRTPEEKEDFKEAILGTEKGRIAATVAQELLTLKLIFGTSGAIGRAVFKPLVDTGLVTKIIAGAPSPALKIAGVSSALTAFERRLAQGVVTDLAAGEIFGIINELEDEGVNLVENLIATPLMFVALGLGLRASAKYLSQFLPLKKNIDPKIIEDPLFQGIVKDAQRSVNAFQKFAKVSREDSVEILLRASKGEVTNVEANAIMTFFMKNPEMLSNNFNLQIARQLRPKLAPEFTVIPKGRMEVSFQDTAERIDQFISPKNLDEAVALAERARSGEIFLKEVKGTESQLSMFREIFEPRAKPTALLEFKPIPPKAPVSKAPDLPGQAEAGFERVGIGAPEPRKVTEPRPFVPGATATEPAGQRFVLPARTDLIPTAAEITERKLGVQPRELAPSELEPGEPGTPPPTEADIVPGKQPVSPTGEVILPGAAPTPEARIVPGFAFTPGGRKVKVDAFGLPVPEILTQVQMLERQMFSSAVKDMIETVPLPKKVVIKKLEKILREKREVSPAIKKRVEKVGGKITDSTIGDVTFKVGDRTFTVERKGGITTKKLKDAIERERRIAPDTLSAKTTTPPPPPLSGSEIASHTSQTKATIISTEGPGGYAVEIAGKKGFVTPLEDGTVATDLIEPVEDLPIVKKGFLLESIKRKRGEAAELAEPQFDQGAESVVRTKAGRKATTFHDAELDTIKLTEVDTGITTTISKADMMEAIREGRIIPTSETITQLSMGNLLEVQSKLESSLRATKGQPLQTQKALAIREKMDDIITEFQRRTGRLTDGVGETSAFMESEYRKFLDGEKGEAGLGLCPP